MIVKRAIILLGAETPQVLYCIDSLRARDVHIICVGSGTVFYSSFNRHVENNIHLRDLAHFPSDSRFENIFDKYQEVYLYALNETYQELLAYKSVGLPDNVKIIMPNAESVLLVSDKSEFLDLCTNLNVPVLPYCRLDKEVGQHYLNSCNIPFPWILKPNRGSGARGFMVVSDRSQLESLNVSKLDGYHVQQYLKCAKQYKFTASCKDGNLLNGVCLHKIRYFPVSGGSCTFGEIVDIKEISDICSKIITELKWDGIIDFDILSPGPDEYYPIEINPRLPACAKYSHCACVDLIDDIFVSFLGVRPINHKWRSSKYVHFITLDLARAIALIFSLNISGISDFTRALLSRAMRVDYYREFKFSLVSSLLVQASKVTNFQFLKNKFFKNG